MRAAVLGSPIAHSRSPQLHLAAYRELGLTDWTYDRTSPPAGRPVQLTVQRQVVPTARPYGSAATLDATGRVVMFACDRPANLFDPSAFGPCQ